MQQLDKDLYLAWREHHGTKALMQLLAERKLEIMEEWAAGGLVEPFTSQKVGQCQALEAIMNVSYEDLSGESNGE